MFCPKCGKKNLEGARFCTSCGKPLAIEKEMQKSKPTKDNGPQKKSPLPLIIILLVILLVVLGGIGVGIVYFVKNRQAEQKNDKVKSAWQTVVDASSKLADDVEADSFSVADSTTVQSGIDSFRGKQSEIDGLLNPGDLKSKFDNFSGKYITYLEGLRDSLKKYPSLSTTLIEGLDSKAMAARSGRDEIEDYPNTLFVAQMNDDIFNVVPDLRIAFAKASLSNASAKAAAKLALTQFLEIYCKSQDVRSTNLQSLVTPALYNSSEIQAMLAGTERVYVDYSIISFEKVDDSRYNSKVNLSAPASEMGPAAAAEVIYPVVKSGSNWLVDKP